MQITFDDALVRRNTIAVEAARLTELVQDVREVVTNHDYSNDLASVVLAGDPQVLNVTAAAIAGIDIARLKIVFLIGIGGSNLGTKAIYDTFFGWSDFVGLPGGPRLVCIDTNNPLLLASCAELIAALEYPEDYVVVSISKSGNTTETIANTEIILAMLDDRWPGQADRVIVIGDEESSFVESATALGMRTATLPRKVGGRYSVMSPVGIVPLALLGIDVEALSAGAEAMVQECIHPEVTQNPALSSALIRLTEYQAGKHIHDWFTFRQELTSLGAWWRQLVGESLGKTKGKEVFGITPTISVGSTDLHSVGQLYFGGPKNKFLTFIEVADNSVNYVVPEARIFPDQVPMVTHTSVVDIMSAISSGTKSACIDRGIPFMNITFNELSEFELGQYMQYAMLETIYLGRLLGINPFDQPDVEAYKIRTKELLESL